MAEIEEEFETCESGEEVVEETEEIEDIVNY